MRDPDQKNESIVQQMRGRAQEMQNRVTEKLADASGGGREMLKEMADELDETLPLIRELGYSVDGVVIGLGLIPDVQIQISGLSKTMDDDAYHRILDQQRDRKLLCSVLRALQTASSMHDRLHILGMHSDAATITLGVPPKISLKFERDVLPSDASKAP